FNPTTTIEFEIQKSGPVTLEIFNLMGQKVASVVNQNLNPGTYKVIVDGSNLASGIYFYRLTAGEYSAIKKMTLVK
ncbi:MAG: T9SS C-terminal target domain-containing protein, partial [Methanobacteriota archaeon]